MATMATMAMHRRKNEQAAPRIDVIVTTADADLNIALFVKSADNSHNFSLGFLHTAAANPAHDFQFFFQHVCRTSGKISKDFFVDFGAHALQGHGEILGTDLTENQLQ
jgi:hypothetical protein